MGLPEEGINEFFQETLERSNFSDNNLLYDYYMGFKINFSVERRLKDVS